MEEQEKVRKEREGQAEESRDNPQDEMFREAVLGQEEISVETVAAMWPNITMGEFLEEMKHHGMRVTISRKAKEPECAEPTPEQVDKVHLAGQLEDTPENRERYLKMRELAREKLGDSGIVEAFLEHDPVNPHEALDEEALEELNSASYQGNFGELSELSKKLKENEDPKP